MHPRSRFSLAHLPTLSPSLWAVIVIAASSILPAIASNSRPAAQQEARPTATAQQEDKAIRLSAALVTVVTSVSDATGEPVNDLRQSEFEVYEDNTPQDIAGLYHEGQIPLRLLFLFDTSGSIRHRFDFEQRAAARFFRQVMRPGDQGAIMSVATESTLEMPFTSDVNKLVDTLARLQPGGATALYKCNDRVSQVPAPF